MYRDSDEGKKVCTYYNLVSIPAILVIDPITGQKMRAWSGMVQPERLLEVLKNNWSHHLLWETMFFILWRQEPFIFCCFLKLFEQLLSRICFHIWIKVQKNIMLFFLRNVQEKWSRILQLIHQACQVWYTLS